ncbi:hypothetical protein E0L93_14595 [Rubrobacter taiwanensis]|uniref:Uncharacterized protein n=1 Tax=Rubrobacter taiwanensis TaxID=185139 RepID=A0A4R1B9R0_9ACTN|nr:hypothetical protein E0L93_14595 [Rubrobacter taiwanensis]
MYGVAFTVIKSFFPFPLVMLFTVQGEHPEGDLGLLATVYLASGLLAGLVGGPLYGLLLLWRGGNTRYAVSSARRLPLSLGLGIFIGVISTALTVAAYLTGLLPPGGVMDPLNLIRASIHEGGGIPLLIGWTLARDLLPAGLTGLFLAPIGGGLLLKLRAKGGGETRVSGEGGL